MMIATRINAATSERTRSSVFDLGFAAVSGGGTAYVGGCSSPANQPTVPDVARTHGRLAMTSQLNRPEVRICRDLLAHLSPVSTA
jgi:hypothetical protein